MIVNRGQMASILGISEPTLDRMVQRREVIGRKKGNHWEFDTKLVINKLVKDAAKDTKGSKKASAELRIALSDAELKEFKVAEMRRTMLHEDDIIPLFEEQLTIIKSKVTALPARLAQRLAVEDDPAEILRLLKGEIADALDEIASAPTVATHEAKPELPDDDEASEEDEEDEEEAPVPTLTDDGY